MRGNLFESSFYTCLCLALFLNLKALRFLIPYSPMAPSLCTLKPFSTSIRSKPVARWPIITRPRWMRKQKEERKPKEPKNLVFFVVIALNHVVSTSAFPLSCYPGPSCGAFRGILPWIIGRSSRTAASSTLLTISTLAQGKRFGELREIKEMQPSLNVPSSIQETFSSSCFACSSSVKLKWSNHSRWRAMVAKPLPRGSANSISSFPDHRQYRILKLISISVPFSRSVWPPTAPSRLSRPVFAW